MDAGVGIRFAVFHAVLFHFLIPSPKISFWTFLFSLVLSCLLSLSFLAWLEDTRPGRIACISLHFLTLFPAHSAAAALI